MTARPHLCTGRAELLRAVAAAMAPAAHGEAKKARPRAQEAATAGQRRQTSGAVHQACAACDGAHRAHTCGKAAGERGGLERPPAGDEIIGPTARRCRDEPDEAGWARMLERLAAYRAERGDCNVPKGWAEDPALSWWV